MSAGYTIGSEGESGLPSLAQRVQDMARGACNWTRVAESMLDEFVAPLRVLGFAALERPDGDVPFTTNLSHGLPLLKVGKAGPRATIASFVEAAMNPGKVIVTEDVAGAGALACAVLPSDSGPQHLIVLAGRVPSVSNALLAQCAQQLLELVRPAVGGAAAKAPADAVSIAIRRAKQEWETVADGLPAMVGLADVRGRILRVNRSWTRVRGKGLGRSIHSLLHGDCTAPDCRFALTLASALKLLPGQPKLLVKTRDRKRDGSWAVYLRFIPPREGRGARVVFSISEVTDTVTVGAEDEGAPTRAQRELAQLLERHHLLLDAQRRRFAADLQRALGHALTEARLGVERVTEALRVEGASPALLEQLERSVALLDGVSQDGAGRAEPSPPVAEEGAGLAPSLRALCADWQLARHDRDVRVVCAVDDRNVPRSLWLTIYRIVHESLYGIGGPSPRRSLGITLVPGDKALLLAIEQGDAEGAPGCAPDGDSPGVQMMRELAEFSGGSFHFEATSEGGLSVEVLWPRPTRFSQLVVVPTPRH